MELKYSKKLALSPAFVFVMEAFVELVKAGHTVHKMFFSNNSHIVYMEHEGKVIGALVYMIDEVKEGNILFSHVLPEYRRQGIYKLMYADAEYRLINYADARVIISFTWHDNEAMKEAYKATGRELTSIRVEKVIIENN